MSCPLLYAESARKAFRLSTQEWILLCGLIYHKELSMTAQCTMLWPPGASSAPMPDRQLRTISVLCVNINKVIAPHVIKRRGYKARYITKESRLALFNQIWEIERAGCGLAPQTADLEAQ